jgi:hypothetical protein
MNATLSYQYFAGGIVVHRRRGGLDALLQQKCSGSDDSILAVHAASNSFARRVGEFFRIDQSEGGSVDGR